MPTLVNEILEAEVGALSHDGRGVARIEGKVVFIDQALPDERVLFLRGKKRRSQETGKAVEILRRSPDRVQPPCEYFGVCGGCALQHLSPAAQARAKQQQLKDNLARIAKVEPEAYTNPLTGRNLGYRRKARLGVRYVPKKGGILVGFRERNKSYITPLAHCAVLDPRLSLLLPALRELLQGISCGDRIPQIEVAAGDNTISLVFRHLQDFNRADLDRLSRFAEDNGVQVYLQPNGLDSVAPLFPSTPERLFYGLDPYQIDIFFEATDFIQVNGELNSGLVRAAVGYLDPQPGDTILDLFCGLGNFTLPLAQRAAEVVGVEGSATLVERASTNAASNNIDNTTFLEADLYHENPAGAWLARRYDKVLLDPPRTGAIEVVKNLARLNPDRVVYISCNPATLARDTEVLVHKFGYTLKSAGIVDMFPHTTHVESIAVFER